MTWYLVLAGAVLSLILAFVVTHRTEDETPSCNAHTPLAVETSSKPLEYEFSVSGRLQEAGSMEESTSPYFWLNSGGLLIIENDEGRTLRGELPLLSRWRLTYARANRDDTDNGYHPQNIFRLITKSAWDNVRIEGSFYIDRDQLSDSENRNESNGLLLMSRYHDSDNLYYSGVRVDGHAVIKKKYCGTYYTMAEEAVYDGVYDKENAPNLLPHHTWIYLRSDTITNRDGTITIVLYTREHENDEWREILRATDEMQFDNTLPLTIPAFVGIRTDFMDVTFGSFSAFPISSS